MKKIAVFMGTRPEGIKMAPVIRALRAAEGLAPIVVSTGQHREMLKQVTDLFGIELDHDLAVMQPNQTLASLSARLLTSIDDLLQRERPDMALVQGDTTTVLAATLACFYRQIPVGHVEAGLRTGNLLAPFPEEANRRLAAPLVTLHFAPTEFGRRNLLREGVSDSQIAVTGNTVIDALLMEVQRQSQPEAGAQIEQELRGLLGPEWAQRPSVLITGHRRENFGDGFEQICDALLSLAGQFPSHWFIYPVHLNPNVQKPVYERLSAAPNIRLIPPVGYSLFVCLMRHCMLVLTDSGGVQEEAPSLGKPVLVMRDTTERPEGVEGGTVKLVGARAQSIMDSVAELLTDNAAYRAMAEAFNPYGDGNASHRIVRRIQAHFTRG
jgi:UDP-N-acetylglucosamine 2-epimerase (non-hydrolysing)